MSSEQCTNRVNEGAEVESANQVQVTGRYHSSHGTQPLADVGASGQFVNRQDGQQRECKHDRRVAQGKERSNPRRPFPFPHQFVGGVKIAAI